MYRKKRDSGGFAAEYGRGSARNEEVESLGGDVVGESSEMVGWEILGFGKAQKCNHA